MHAEVEHAADLLRLLVVRGEHDDGHGRERPYALEHFEAVDVGETEIEDHEVGGAARRDDHHVLARADVEHLEVGLRVVGLQEPRVE